MSASSASPLRTDPGIYMFALCKACVEALGSEWKIEGAYGIAGHRKGDAFGVPCRRCGGEVNR